MGFYDVIAIGSRGRGALAYPLAPIGKRILLERGDYLPKQKANWGPGAVFADQCSFIRKSTTLATSSLMEARGRVAGRFDQLGLEDFLSTKMTLRQRWAVIGKLRLGTNHGDLTIEALVA